MRVLITGATGLIGRALGQKLVAAGHEVRVLSRNKIRAQAELGFPAEVLEWPRKTEWATVLSAVDAVVHLAGESVAEGRWTAEKKRRIYESRVLTTRELVDAVLQTPNQVQTFVMGSAIGVYGDRGDEKLFESSVGGSPSGFSSESPSGNPDAFPAGSPIKGKDFLAKVVVDWENELARLNTRATIRQVIVRTGVVLDNQGGALAKLLPMFMNGLGGPLAGGRNWMSWIALEDICRVFQFVITDQRVRGVINGVAPEPIQNRDFTATLAKVLHVPAAFPVPAVALKLLLGEMSQVILASQRVIPQALLNYGFSFNFPNLSSYLLHACAPLSNGDHEMIFEQWVPHAPANVFPFFADEKNLESLTPPFLNFKVLGKSSEAINEGTLIDYQLHLHGVPLKWRSRIEQWEPNQKFVDLQLKGPYRKWHHTHEFIAFGGGTLLRDRVLFRLPLGFFGSLIVGSKVQKDILNIFAYRRSRMGELLDAHIQNSKKSKSS